MSDLELNKKSATEKITNQENRNAAVRLNIAEDDENQTKPNSETMESVELGGSNNQKRSIFKVKKQATITFHGCLQAIAWKSIEASMLIVQIAILTMYAICCCILFLLFLFICMVAIATPIYLGLLLFRDILYCAGVDIPEEYQPLESCKPKT